ncbi:MAG: MCP four helix bundle domain-containing protein [Mariprofundus sp.]|nr:MCP four helix bundle domain-containing protein [Mariprofundus sp.]
MFNNLNIGTRLSFGFGIVFILFCTLTIFSINRMEYLAINTSQIYNHPLTVSNAVLRINAHIVKMHRSMKDVALDENIAQINRDAQLVNAFETEVYADFDIINKLFLGDKTLFDAARQAFVSWKPIRDEVTELMRAGKSHEAARITKGKGAQHVAKIENAMDVLNVFAQGKAAEFLGSAERTTNQSITTMYLLLLFVVIGMMVFTIYLTRSITRPIEALRSASLEIGKGKFDTQLNIEAGGELGELATSVRKMTSSLSKVTASRDALNKEILIVAPCFETGI